MSMGTFARGTKAKTRATNIRMSMGTFVRGTKTRAVEVMTSLESVKLQA